MKLVISHSPHIRSSQSVESIMWNVVLALVPAFLASIYFFGFNAIIVTLIAILSCVATEFSINKYLFKQDEFSFKDGSAVLTGMLLAFNLPANIPIYMVIVGSIVAIAVAKASFGGLGQNIFNPALVGRVFLLISYPVEMTTWPVNRLSELDATTAATPLSIIKEGVKNGENITSIINSIPNQIDMLVGNMGGCIGEVSALALLLGFAYMLVKKIITWHIPVSVFVGAFVMAAILAIVSPDSNPAPEYHLLSGGLMLGAIFMATDMVTSPMSKKGMFIFGGSIGIITIFIRTYGAYPEGVSFAILIMNAFVPLINKYFKPSKFGGK